ncbi:MAG: outer membrane protein assembly factor BamD [Kiritimatiellia bacterium]|nr:outer membrane protein assembly factor BamD [Kiritimatiellia bacterium]
MAPIVSIACCILAAGLALASQTPDLVQPYTLQSAAEKAIEQKGKLPSKTLFEAALAADWCGDKEKSRNILGYLLQCDPSANDYTRRALIRLIRSAGTPARYARYLTAAPRNGDTLALGLELLENLGENGLKRDYAALFEILLDAYPNGPESAQIFRHLFDHFDRRRYLETADLNPILQTLATRKTWQETAPALDFLDLCARRQVSRTRLHTILLSRPDIFLTTTLSDYLLSDNTIPPKEALALLKKRLQHNAILPKDIDRFTRQYQARYQNALTNEWKTLLAEVQAGKYAKPTRDCPLQKTAQMWELQHRKWGQYKSDAERQTAILQAFDGLRPQDISLYDNFAWLCDRLAEFDEKNPELKGKYPFQLLERILFNPCWRNIDTWRLSHYFRAADRANRLDAAVQTIDATLSRLTDGSPKASPAFASRLAAALLYVSTGTNPWDKYYQEPGLDKNQIVRPKNPKRDILLRNLEWLPRFAKQLPPELITIPGLWGMDVNQCYHILNHRKDKDFPQDQIALGKQADQLVALNTYLLAQGAVFYETLGGKRLPSQIPAERITPETGLGAYSPYYIAASAWREPMYPPAAIKLAETLLSLKAPELAYLLIVRNLEGAREKHDRLQQLLTEAAEQMPGLYPVKKGDAAYPIYVAAEAYARNNPERAWQLLNANRKAFDANPLRFPPSFTLWALDQYRKVRGTADALRNKAWEHIERLLQNENALTPEVAAGLFLLRARIAEDRLQYDQAHAGYQALRANNRYKGTRAARQAMFRDVDLLLQMGAADSASQIAEQWCAMPEPDVRAYGHYILAKVAFANQDFDQTRVELDKVFSLDFTHAEARLLQGEWKLATNYEVDDPQVLLGDLSDRSTIRPGSPLTVSIQDRNLSVAGGGSSIPVILETSAGKDRERLLLYPGTRDPSLFRGSIDTVAGVAKAGNGTVELVGDDTLSYRVDPEFLKARGLAESAAKRLAVVDDATLGVNERSQAKHLKPGLPVRIRVTDRDCSSSAGAQRVKVSLSTTSGDRLSAELKETSAGSGVFEGSVRTALPPPRAYASDSAAGMGPEDLISTGRNRPWESLADGKKPKSVGVDTMGSYEVSSASVALVAPETVVSVRLWGELFGEESLMGAFPREEASRRQGIRCYALASQARSKADFLRELVTRSVVPAPAKTWGVTRDKGPYLRHLLRGTVCVPETQTLKLRFRPTQPDTKEPNNNLRWLVATLYVDGVPVLGNVPQWDIGYKRKAHEVTLTAGCHDLELYATHLERACDSFEVCIEQDDGSLAPLPPEWLDPAKNPALAEHLSDKCDIQRTPEGFTAKFLRPRRLRALRWEFLDFNGKSLSARKLTLLDKAGKTIVPSARDYTQALGNSTLEVAPGDRITVAYEDQNTTSGKTRVLEKRLSTAFADGIIEFLSEQIAEDDYGHTSTRYHKAYRVAPGDTLVVRITDPDLDLSPDQDTIPLTLVTQSGAKLQIEAKEPISLNEESGDQTVSPANAGRFIALVRTAPKKPGDTSAPPEDTLPLAPGDTIAASYRDEDNTKPGVPIDRTARIGTIPKTEVTIHLADTALTRIPDKSPEAQTRLSALRRRGETTRADLVWKDHLSARFRQSDTPAKITPHILLPVTVRAPALARNAGSTIMLRVTTKRELDAATAAGGHPEYTFLPIGLGSTPRIEGIKFAGLSEKRLADGELPDTFSGALPIYCSQLEEQQAQAEEVIPDDSALAPVRLKPTDLLLVQAIDEEGAVLAQAQAQIATTAWIGLTDPSGEAQNATVHLGEPLRIRVYDPDRDVSDEQDEINVEAKTSQGISTTVRLRETMAHSGIFTATLIPALETNQVENLQSIKAGYGQTIDFSYADEVVSEGDAPGVRTVRAHILPGSDGGVRAYSKRFRDSDQAVLVQFRLAECLFEMAKDSRKLGAYEKSAAAIADGRAILEAALRDYPDTRHAAEGAFLLANLYEQLAEESRQDRLRREKEGEDLSKVPDAAAPLFREAVARFSSILSAWPEGECAARSQYHKALCLERLGDFQHAAEEYVKMTYLFPDSPQVGDASVRLASYYYTKLKRYDIAAKIYASFRNRCPDHPQAAKALFMSGQCFVKRAEALAEERDEKGNPPPQNLIVDNYAGAIDSFESLLENYKGHSDKDLLAQTLYWLGDAYFRIQDYGKAYLSLKRCAFEYPESKWARYARGLLATEAKAFEHVVND